MAPTKVLFIGMGSIGRRNLASCRRVRPALEYAAWRSGVKRAGINDEPTGVRELSSLEEVERFGPDVAWICNPTSMHLETTRALLAAKLPKLPALFLEKPLAHTAADASEIAGLVGRHGVPFFYGCLLRLHPLTERVKDLLDGGTLGRPVAYTTYSGSYLPGWRPTRDYRGDYSASRALGGGVTLDLIHDFDYPVHLFGDLASATGVRGHLSHLEIDSDDVCCATLTHAGGVVGNVSVNYLRPVPRRDFEIVLTNGLLTGDYNTGALKLVARKADGSLEERQETHAIDRDALHDRQSLVVFETLEGKRKNPWSVEQISAMLGLVLTIRQAGPRPR